MEKSLEAKDKIVEGKKCALIVRRWITLSM